MCVCVCGAYFFLCHVRKTVLQKYSKGVERRPVPMLWRPHPSGEPSSRGRWILFISSTLGRINDSLARLLAELGDWHLPLYTPWPSIGIKDLDRAGDIPGYPRPAGARLLGGRQGRIQILCPLRTTRCVLSLYVFHRTRAWHQRLMDFRVNFFIPLSTAMWMDVCLCFACNQGALAIFVGLYCSYR